MLFARIYYLKLSFPIASGTKPFYTYFYKIQIKNENNKRYNVNFTQSQKKNKIKKYQYYYDNIFILFTYVNANILTYVWYISHAVWPVTVNFSKCSYTLSLYIYTYTHILYFRGNFDVCELFEPFDEFDRLKCSWGRDDLSPN